MKATTIFDNLSEQYIYMERYVNEGSPSGFTQIHTTSYDTNPFTGKDTFKLLQFKDDDCETIIVGKRNEILCSNMNYAHPDSLKSTILKESGRKLEKSQLIVSPTASGRTMLIRNSGIKGFLKLTYDTSKIGRCRRDISTISANASLETSKVIKDSIDNGNLPKCFAILPEETMRISKLYSSEGVFEWGSIFRSFEAYPKSLGKVQIIPAFSLFSKDTRCPDDDYLINQFIELSNQNPEEYLWKIIKMTLDAFWGLMLNCGLRAEMHSQNCMYEINTDYTISRIILKDMEDVDRDLILQKFVGFNHKWNTYPYKCYDANSKEFEYRASYMYDFKLGEYLITPIIQRVVNKYELDSKKIEQRIQKYVSSKYLPLLPKDYFPKNNQWYYCKNEEVLPGENRKFYSKEHPKYR
mgnify:CR=1 FL=1